MLDKEKYFYSIEIVSFWGLHGGVGVGAVTSQQEGSCFESRLGPRFQHVLPLCAWVLSGYSG